MNKSFVIGTEYGTGKTLVLTIHEGPRCGYDCPCCLYPDGTAPADHARDCDLITSTEGECTCDAQPRVDDDT